MTSAWVTWQKSFFRGMNMLNCLAVGAGGFVGAVLRYLVS